MSAVHRIDELVFDIAYDSRSAAIPSESYLSQLLTGKLLPAVDEVLDSLGHGDEVLRVPTLELDLGVIDHDDAENQLTQKLRNALDDALRRLLPHSPRHAAMGGPVSADGERSPVSVVSRQASGIEELAGFLASGTMPWHADVNRPGLHSALLERLLEAGGAALWAMLSHALAHEASAQRLVAQFPEQQLRSVLMRANPEHAPQFLALIAEARGWPTAHGGQLATQTVWRQVLAWGLVRGGSAAQALDACERIRAGLSGQAPRPASNGGVAAASAVSHARMLAGFSAFLDGVPLDSGIDHEAAPYTPVQLLDRLLANGGAGLQSVVRLALERSASTRRLLDHIPGPRLKAMLMLANPAAGEQLQAMVERVQDGEAGTASAPELRRMAWEQVLRAAFSRRTAAPALHEASASIARKLSQLSGKDASHFSALLTTPAANEEVPVLQAANPGTQAQPSATPAVSRHSQLVRLCRFLEHGVLREMDEGGRGSQTHEALLDAVLAQADEALWNALARALETSASARRLLEQFPRQQLSMIAHLSAPAFAAPLERLIERVTDADGDGIDPGGRGQALFRVCWRHVLAACTARPQGQLTPASVYAKIALELASAESPDGSRPDVPQANDGGSPDHGAESRVRYETIVPAPAAASQPASWRGCVAERRAGRALVRLAARLAELGPVAEFSADCSLAAAPVAATPDHAKPFQRAALASLLYKLCGDMDAALDASREAAVEAFDDRTARQESLPATPYVAIAAGRADAAALRRAIAAHIGSDAAIPPGRRTVLLESIDEKAMEAWDPAEFLRRVLAALTKRTPLDLEALRGVPRMALSVVEHAEPPLADARALDPGQSNSFSNGASDTAQPAVAGSASQATAQAMPEAGDNLPGNAPTGMQLAAPSEALVSASVHAHSDTTRVASPDKLAGDRAAAGAEALHRARATPLPATTHGMPDQVQANGEAKAATGTADRVAAPVSAGPQDALPATSPGTPEQKQANGVAIAPARPGDLHGESQASGTTDQTLPEAALSLPVGALPDDAPTTAQPPGASEAYSTALSRASSNRTPAAVPAGPQITLLAASPGTLDHVQANGMPSAFLDTGDSQAEGQTQRTAGQALPGAASNSQGRDTSPADAPQTQVKDRAIASAHALQHARPAAVPAGPQNALPATSSGTPEQLQSNGVAIAPAGPVDLVVESQAPRTTAQGLPEAAKNFPNRVVPDLSPAPLPAAAGTAALGAPALAGALPRAAVDTPANKEPAAPGTQRPGPIAPETASCTPPIPLSEAGTSATVGALPEDPQGELPGARARRNAAASPQLPPELPTPAMPPSAANVIHVQTIASALIAGDFSRLRGQWQSLLMEHGQTIAQGLRQYGRSAAIRRAIAGGASTSMFYDLIGLLDTGAPAVLHPLIEADSAVQRVLGADWAAWKLRCREAAMALLTASSGGHAGTLCASDLVQQAAQGGEALLDSLLEVLPAQFRGAGPALTRAEVPLPPRLPQRTAAALPEKQRVWRMPTAADEAAIPPDTQELVVVGNAGMVLAAPYLPRLFSMLGLTENGAFVHTQAAARAVHLVQFMVNGHTSAPEYQLVLNKILCGVKTAAPLPASIDITQAEKDAIEGMIGAIVAHWTALGKSSVEAVRQTFFARQGDLQLVEDAWQLEVRPGPFDMLLDRLPWSISVVKFAWMARPVHVQWRATT